VEHASEIPSPEPAVPPDEAGRHVEPIKLPSTRSMQRWHGRTRHLLDLARREEARATEHHRALVSKARDAIDASKEVVLEKRRVVQALKRIIGSVQIGDEPSPVREGVPEAGARWHPRFAACKDCGTTDPARPHHARGRCRDCAGIRWPRADAR
jgi:hypothetical protein